MVSLGGLGRTFEVTKNPIRTVLSRYTKKSVPIIFKNGSRVRLTWEEFTFIRDNYAVIKRFQFENYPGNFFHIVTDRYEFVGSPIIMIVIAELEQGQYDCDCKGKIVLDIGGFQGESAVYFSDKGASKIIVYEPVADHQALIKENVRLNHVNAEIHQEGVADKDGAITINYVKADNCFGILEKGTLKMDIKVRGFDKVLEDSGADIAKIDCEGSEKFLIDVPADTLRKIGYYMIEVHSTDIRKTVIKKFIASGFELVNVGSSQEEVSIVHFRRDN